MGRNRKTIQDFLAEQEQEDDSWQQQQQQDDEQQWLEDNQDADIQ
jgi:hypothetical protein